MDSHITGLDDTDDKIDVEYTELMGHLDLGNIFKLYFLQSLHFIQFRMDSIYTFRFWFFYFVWELGSRLGQGVYLQ